MEALNTFDSIVSSSRATSCSTIPHPYSVYMVIKYGWELCCRLYKKDPPQSISVYGCITGETQGAEYLSVNLGSFSYLGSSNLRATKHEHLLMEISCEGVRFYQSHSRKDFMYDWAKGWLRRPQDGDEIFDLRRRQNLQKSSQNRGAERFCD